MRVRILCIALVAFVAAQTAAQAAAEAAEVSSRRLIENAKFYDGKTVTYKGEAVTAIMKQGNYSWVNVNDGDNAIGIWCRTSLLGKVMFLGNYKTRGDSLTIEGVFNRACEEHGGDLDIHADTVVVEKQGWTITEKVNRKKVRLAFILFFFTIAIVLAFRRRI